MCASIGVVVFFQSVQKNEHLFSRIILFEAEGFGGARGSQLLFI
jgi:hypothetical protein